RQRLTMLLKAAQGKMSENRRRFVRVPLRTEVRCQVGQQNFTGTSVNLSQGGILVELGRILAPGTSVRLSFRLPGTQPMIEATGVVARADEKLRIGVRFTQMASRDIQLIRDLISNEDAEIAEATQRGSIEAAAVVDQLRMQMLIRSSKNPLFNRAGAKLGRS